MAEHRSGDDGSDEPPRPRRTASARAVAGDRRVRRRPRPPRRGADRVLRGALVRAAGDAAGRRLRAVLRRRGHAPARRRARSSTTCRSSQDADRARLERTVDDALDNTGRLGPVSVLLLLVRRERRDGRAAPRDQPGVGHPHAPAAAAPQGARPRARARRGHSCSCSALALPPPAARPTGWATPAGRSTSSATCCRSSFTIGVVLFLYRVLPSPRPKTREIWPGAVVAAR